MLIKESRFYYIHYNSFIAFFFLLQETPLKLDIGCKDSF